jgi:hypothetical protein
MVRARAPRYRSGMVRSFSFVLIVLAAGCSAATTAPTPAPAPSATSPTDPVVPEDPPAKAAPYTEAEVQALFDARCMRCHDATNANIDLSAPFTKTTVGVATGGVTKATLCAKTTAYTVRIVAGDREKSLLWHKVNGTQDCGSPMPYDRGSKPLTATELERLGLYIDGLAN